MDTSKKTLGRRRIGIKKIQNKSHLQVAFSKRRTGLFKKSSELAVLCGAEIAILIQSPAGKMFTFGHPSVEATIDRFLTADNPPPETAATNDSQIIVFPEGTRTTYEEAMMRLEMEKRSIMEEKEGGCWWDEPYEDLNLQELQEYSEALQTLTDNLNKKVEEMEKSINLQSNNIGSIHQFKKLSMIFP